MAAACLALSACTPGMMAGHSAQATPVEAASAAPVPAGLETFYTQKVDWKDCEDGKSFKCATVKVPLDYKDPSGQSIDLALKKLPASSGKPIASLMINPGGPGGSGIELVEGGEAAFSEDLRANFDIVGFDPRGVGASTPLTCLSAEEISQAVEAVAAGGDAQAAVGDDAEASQEDTAKASVEAGREAATTCEQNSPVPGIIDHMDTDSVARDLDVLRALAGDERLYYFGTSYGTFLGTRYAELFPANVGRMVLDSAQDPSIGLAQVGRDQSVAIENSFRSYVETCQSGKDCPLDGDVEAGMAQLRALFEKATKSPLPTDQDGKTVDGETIRQTMTELMYDDGTWESLTSALKQAIKDGKGTELAALAEKPSDETDPKAAAEAEVRKLANQPAISAVDCLDYPVEGDEAQWDKEAAELRKETPTAGGAQALTPGLCKGWGRQSERTPAKASAPGAAPILILGITGDPATPYQWAESLASQLESGHLVTVKGNGHGAYIRTGECATSAVDAYLLRGELPEKGLTCEAEIAQK